MSIEDAIFIGVGFALGYYLTRNYVTTRKVV